MILILIFSFIWLLGILLCVVVLARNNRVSVFRRHIIDLNYKYCIRNNVNDWKFCDKLPSYEKMLYSLKKIEYETYFTFEETKEMLELA